MSTLGIIPARRGSQRCPGKNTADLGGKPLVQWAIDTALETETLTDVVVVSDDPDVLAIAHGAPFVLALPEPEYLAHPDVRMEEVLLWTLDQVSPAYDSLCLLQPTSPFRSADLVDKCVLNLTRHYSAVTVHDGRETGEVYAVRVPEFRRVKRVLIGPVYMVQSGGPVVDIDTPEDLEHARALLRRAG